MDGVDEPSTSTSMATASEAPRPSPGRQLLSVAPMMDWTDLHFRQLARLVSKRTWLWTEMVVDKTVLHHNNLDKLLWFPPEQRPIVLQLGGSDPATLRAAAAVAARYGYDEINLNCGCPSDRVAGAGCFGASLMLTPDLVAECMAAVAEGAGGATPVSVKCRLGADQADTYAQLREFVGAVSERGGVRHFVMHARKCYLQGLNPHQNRTVPPLRPEWVWALKRDFPHLTFTLNGGIASAHEAAAAIALDAAGLGPAAIEGVMIGRAAFNAPWACLGDADRAVFGDGGGGGGGGAGAEGCEGGEGGGQQQLHTRRRVLERYCEYADTMLGRWGVSTGGTPKPSVRELVKPLLNLFHGERDNKRWKAAVDAALKGHPASVRELLASTLHLVPDEVLDAPPRQLGPAGTAAGFRWGADGVAGGAGAPSAGAGREAAAAAAAGASEAPPLADEGDGEGGVGAGVAGAASVVAPPAPPVFRVGQLPTTGTERAGVAQGAPEEAVTSAKREMQDAKRKYQASLSSAKRPAPPRAAAAVAAAAHADDVAALQASSCDVTA